MAYENFDFKVVFGNQIARSSSDIVSGTSETFTAGSPFSGMYVLKSLDDNGAVRFTDASFGPNGPSITYLQTGFQSSNALTFTAVNAPSISIVVASSAIQEGQTLQLASDGSRGAFSFAPCFVSGTHILTTAGEVAVENLQVGQEVVTPGGARKSIRWIGHRTLDCDRHPSPSNTRPVRVLSGAFGVGLPHRDLWISPDHAVCVSVLDEVLIPIKHLLNDATIAQVETAEVTYWHVELDSHDILIAEGLPAESFLDTGVRAGFENGAEHMALHPDFSPLTLDDFCRPLVQEGPIVDAVRLRLLARASELGWALTSEDDLHAVVDGAVVYPEREGAVACFAIPADATEIRLHSRSFVPERVRTGAASASPCAVCRW